MIEKDNGGYAFPWCGDLNECPTINLGITLRDYFAAKATEQDVQKYMFERVGSGPYVFVKKQVMSREEAKFAYADAMLKARNK